MFFSKIEIYMLDWSGIRLEIGVIAAIVNEIVGFLSSLK